MPDRPRTPPTGPAATRTSRTRRAPAPSPYVGRPWLSAYAAGVPHDVEVPNEPLGWLLDQAAAAFPTAIAVSYFGASMTYARLRATVETFASALAGLGVRPGDRVALVLPNCPQYVVAFFATMRLGAVVVPHNPLYTATELRHQLRDCGATAVICLDRTYPAVAAVRADTGVREIVVADLAEHLPLTQRALLHLPLSRARAQRAALVAPVSPAPGVHRYSSLLRRAPTPFGPVAVDPGR
ncbi:MAG TPA: AMP-binding protein, partial [Mycobacteriales bacterium]|nr:AMP-binding protein [Mycobacteriales bacterium]